MTQPYQFIRVERQEQAATIILDRPPLNVLNIQMMEELSAALQVLKEEAGVKVVALTGAGKAFSAGVDVADHLPATVEKMLKAFHAIFYHLLELDKPTLAVINGMALGGGSEVAAFCDMAIAADDAPIGQPEIKLGAYPPLGAVWFPYLVGYRKTFELLLSGEPVQGQEAERLGLINRAVPRAKLQEEAAAFMNRFTSHSGVALKLCRRAILLAVEQHFRQTLQVEEDFYLDTLMRTEDALEGLQAFLEKRQPHWLNR